MKALSRRRVLELAGLGAGLTMATPLLQACSPENPPASTPAAGGLTPAAAASTKSTTAVANAKPTGGATAAAGATSTPLGYAPSAETTPVPTPPSFASISADARDPFKVEPNAQIDAEYFSGGYGTDFLTYLDKLFETLHPGTKINAHMIQREQEQLQPRFVAGSPPDVIYNGGAGDLSVAGLVADGQLEDLTPILKAPSLDTPGKSVQDTLIPGSQQNGMYGGKLYAIQFVSYYNGIWYSSSLFKKKGWTFPDTWDKMIAFSKEIKKAGMNPWTYQGKYPQYMNTLLDAMIFHQSGWDAVLKIDNLEPNAWKQPAVKNAVEAIYELATNDFFMPGTSGLTHTESQAEWLKGNAVFIPCGTWLEREMLKLIPSGFDMVVQPVPKLSGDTQPPTSIEGAYSGDFIVPIKAKFPRAGMEVCRLLLSKAEATFFAEDVLSPMTVAGVSYANIKSTAFQSAQQMLNKAEGHVFNFRYGGWYQKLSTDESNQMGALLTKQIKPSEFMDKVQNTADQVAKDPSITKYKREKPTS